MLLGEERWGTSVARRPPCRWNPLLLPGGVRPRFNLVTSVREDVGYAAIASASLSLALVVMSRRGGSIRSAIGPLLHSSILFRPHQQPPRKRGLMVEAPGYCPPGPKCLFHLTVYRHSRLPGSPQIGILNVNLKDSTVMAPFD